MHPSRNYHTSPFHQVWGRTSCIPLSHPFRSSSIHWLSKSLLAITLRSLLRDCPSSCDPDRPNESPSLLFNPQKMLLRQPTLTPLTSSLLRQSLRSHQFQPAPWTARHFSSSPAKMTINAWFDVEWTDTALDKARTDAARSGGPVPPRKFHLLFTSSSYSAHCLNGSYQSHLHCRQPLCRHSH